MNIAVLQEYARLHGERDRIKAELKEVESRIAEIADVVTNELEQAGMQNTRIEVDGVGRTLYRRVERHPKYKDGADRDTLIEALKADERTAWLVQENYNTNSFGAWYREQDENGTIPEHVAGLVETSEKVSVRVKAG